MLLTYLYTNFMEENAFTAACEVSEQMLANRIEARVFPRPSYIYVSNARSISFVSDIADKATYRFHLKGHAAWLAIVERLGLTTEGRAREHFFNRYDHAKKIFLGGELGKEIKDVASDLPDAFDKAHAASTWEHF